MTEKELSHSPAQELTKEARFFFAELKTLTVFFGKAGDEQETELKEHPVLVALNSFVAELFRNKGALATLRHCQSVEEVAATGIYWELIARLSLPPLPEAKELREDYRYLALALWCQCLTALRSEIASRQEAAADANAGITIIPHSFLLDLGAQRSDSGYRVSDERFNALLSAPSPDVFIRLLLALLNFADFKREPLSVLYVITLWCRDYVQPMNDMTQRSVRFRLAQRFFHNRISD